MVNCLTRYTFGEATPSSDASAEAPPAVAHVSRFSPIGEGADEFHLCIRPCGAGSFSSQLQALTTSYRAACRELQLDAESLVFQHVFLSDAANQETQLERFPFESGPTVAAASLIQQPPLPAAKLALWAYHVRDCASLRKRAVGPGGVALERGELTHLWQLGLVPVNHRGGTVEEQTLEVFERLQASLNESGGDLATSILRTWVYVSDIDRNYNAMVVSRRSLFAAHGLTPETHFFASTGIEGRRDDPQVLVQLGAYAVLGLAPNRRTFLEAPRQLGPTHAYGVTFERGTAVDYGDRRHVIISGTAAIDPAGETLFLGDVVQQTERALDNVAALLDAANAGFGDVAQAIIYLRDSSDLPAIEAVLKRRGFHTPYITVHGRICRSEWLVEIECMAVTPADDPSLGRF